MPKVSFIAVVQLDSPPLSLSSFINSTIASQLSLSQSNFTIIYSVFKQEHLHSQWHILWILWGGVPTIQYKL